jgi:hypothetical protein
MKSKMFSILNITGEKVFYKIEAKSLKHAVEIAVENVVVKNVESFTEICNKYTIGVSK